MNRVPALLASLFATQAAPAITSESFSEGLTLRVTATCPVRGQPCPFSAEVHGSRAIRRMIVRVDYTYTPGHRTPSSIRDASAAYLFKGAQYGGELIHADAIVSDAASGELRKIALETRIPFAAEARPALPAGLRFEDKYWMQFLEGTPSGHYLFHIRLRGDPAALNRVVSVRYRLPEHFHVQERRADRTTEYLLEAGGPRGDSSDIIAVIRWTNGRTSSHAIPFRPNPND